MHALDGPNPIQPGAQFNEFLMSSVDIALLAGTPPQQTRRSAAHPGPIVGFEPTTVTFEGHKHLNTQ